MDSRLEENSLQDIQLSLIHQADLIASQISAESLKKEDGIFLEKLAQTLGSKIKCRITIINKLGKVLADSQRSPEEVLAMENHLHRPEVQVAFRGKAGIDTRYSSTLKINMLYVAMPLKDDSSILAILRLALPLTNVQKTLGEVRKIVFLGLLFALGVAFLLGSILASRTTQPIQKMIQVSRKFAEGDFSRRIILDSKDEIGELAATLNKMAQDLEDRIKEIGSQNQKLTAIFKSMMEGVIVVDKVGRIVSVNPAIEKIFGVLNVEAKGKVFLEVMRNNDIAGILSAVLEQGKSLSQEIVLVYPMQRTFEVNAVPLFDNRVVAGCLAVIHDITEMRKLETVRRDFVANVSHELKTPLTSIKGFVETLLEGALEDKDNARQFLKIIQDHTNRLDYLINDLLELSHLEARGATLEMEFFEPARLIQDVLLNFKSQFKKKDIIVKNEVPEGLTIKANKGKIQQVFTNLIDNAVKFNKDKGTIFLRCESFPGKIKIIVEDSGIGIPGKDLSRIFERFYRVDKARSRELGGTGLGLSIIKHIVELHGGVVGVESTEGFGSKFWFVLPQ